MDVVVDRTPQHLTAAIREQFRHEIKFRVGGFPRQEVGGTLLAGRADHQIAVGNIRVVQVLSNHLLRHAIARDLAVTNLACNRCARVRDFGATTIVQAEHHIDGLVVLRLLLCHFQLVDHGLPQLRPAARPAHAHAPLVHLIDATVDDVTREAHKETHLLR